MVSKLYFLVTSRVYKTWFSWFDHVWCGIFSTWRPPGNQVFKTRFISQPYKTSKIMHLQPPSHQRRKREEKKKPEIEPRNRTPMPPPWPRPEWSEWVTQPKLHCPSRAARVALPSLHLHFFFFFFSLSLSFFLSAFLLFLHFGSSEYEWL